MIPRKVTLFIHGAGPGTFTRIATALIRGFNEMGVTDCDLLVLNASEKQKKLHPHINVVSLDVKHATHALLPLVSYLNQHKPDVIFPMPWYFNVISILACRLARTHTKVIMGEHNIISLEAGVEHRQNLKLRYLPLIMRYTYPFGDGVIGVSQDVINDLQDKVKIPAHVPATVVNNGIDIEQVKELASEPITHPWFQEHDIPVILTTARLAKQKQLDVLIRAFSIVRKNIAARLLILGEGNLRSELLELCSDLKINDCVSMPGYVSNPYSFMANCDIFVLASAWEGCPISLIEAFACGAAVIVNDAPGGSKELIDYGKYGILTPAGDEIALASSITQILTNSDLKEHYKRQSSARAQDFQYMEMSKRYFDFYSEIVSKKEGVA